MNYRPTLGRQKCDTVAEFSVYVVIAVQIQSRHLMDSSERERDSGASFWSPEVNCRPPLGSQKCDTVVEFNVCVILAGQIQSLHLIDSSERERDAGTSCWSPPVN